MVKTSVLLLCLLAFILPTKAQQAGEAYVHEGIPCIIIDVDDTGTHGLVMSLIPINKTVKAAEKTGEEHWFYIGPKKVKGKTKKLIDQYSREIFTQYKCDTVKVRQGTGSKGVGGIFGLAAAIAAAVVEDRVSTSFSGKENTQNIINYCNENDINMETYFPVYAWVQTLGKDWFIPGINELKLYGKNVYGYEEIGEDYKIKTSEFLKRDKDRLNIWTNSIIANPDETFVGFIYPSLNVYSSTLASTRSEKNADKDVSCLSTCSFSNVAGHWLDIIAQGGSICAVCEVNFK